MDLEHALLSWVATENNIEAVIKIGSRAQKNAVVDQWSDWDYQIICKSIKPYLTYKWEEVFKLPVLCANTDITPRGVPKATLIFANGGEVELVFLTAWQIRLVYFFMRYPKLYPKLPGAIRRGIGILNVFVKPGYQVLKGGTAWERRLSALNNPIPAPSLKDLPLCITQFWVDAAWMYKQIMRGNFHAAQKMFHNSLRTKVYSLLELDGGLNTPIDARRIECWLSKDKLEKISAGTAPEREALVKALIMEMHHFAELSNSVSKQYDITLPDCSALKGRLLEQCNSILHPNR